jgi:GMP synthase (glutamine-hydrolysing)
MALSAPNIDVIIWTMPIRGVDTPEAALHPVLTMTKLKELRPDGIVFSGSGNYVYTQEGRIPPTGFLEYIIQEKIPLLGICYGHQLVGYLFNELFGDPAIRVISTNPSGKHELLHSKMNPMKFPWNYQNYPTQTLFSGLPSEFEVWMYHRHQIRILPSQLVIVGGTTETPISAVMYPNPNIAEPFIFGMQFHPETSPASTKEMIFQNFRDKCIKFRAQRTN